MTQLESYFSYIFELLGAGSLRVKIEWVAAETEFHARLKMYDDLEARMDGDVKLELNVGVLDFSRAALRELACHEGTHASLHQMMAPIDDALRNGEQIVAAELVVALEEQYTEKMGRLFAPLVPLPPATLLLQAAAERVMGVLSPQNEPRSKGKRKNTQKKG